MTRPTRPALFALPSDAGDTDPSRRAALATIAAVLLALDVARKAERAFLDAERRVSVAAGSQRVAIPTATGGIRYETTAAGIDRAIKEERNRASFISARWQGELPRTVASLTDAERAAAKAWTRPDAEALKADLAERQARLAAAMDAERVADLKRADRDAWAAFLATPATTAAGIAAKLRVADTSEPSISAALDDLDRMGAAA